MATAMNEPGSKKIAAACLILAGGQGKRLTPDKPLLKINNQAIIERATRVVVPLFEKVFLVTNTPEKYEFLHLPVVRDEKQGCGPLMGIYSGLQKIKHDAAFVCAADMPFVEEKIIRAQFQELGAFDIVVPCPKNRPEFLHAVFRKRCLPAIRRNLEAGIFKIEMLVPLCQTRRLDKNWFALNGFSKLTDRTFTNINTIRGYRRWLQQGAKHQGGLSGRPPLGCVVPEVLRKIRRTLVEQETAFQDRSARETCSSIWSHSSRVARIAHHIARSEGWDPEPALLAGLLHDAGKFADGSYHEDDVPEERNAVRLARRILTGTIYERWLPMVSEAILSTFLEGRATSDIGRAVYDADCLDKLGNLGVVQFFTKKALRRQFLDDEVMVRTSIELTYAHHAPGSLKTATGRTLARARRIRTRSFYTGLLDEWQELGLGEFKIVEEEIAGVVCILVVPGACSCGQPLERRTDIRDALKCRSVVVEYRCKGCGFESEFSFCLPNVKGLPEKPNDRVKGALNDRQAPPAGD
ncbi:NTP transferase domain-containing protein [Desulfosarcina alkanivorans]|nr:NTP transferase domain-containing protein [Desulfosarcina alkanivorans]